MDNKQNPNITLELVGNECAYGNEGIFEYPYFILLTFFLKHRLLTCITRLINVKMKGREASLRTKRRTKHDL